MREWLILIGVMVAVYLIMRRLERRRMARRYAFALPPAEGERVLRYEPPISGTTYDPRSSSRHYTPGGWYREGAAAAIGDQRDPSSHYGRV